MRSDVLFGVVMAGVLAAPSARSQQVLLVGAQYEPGVVAPIVVLADRDERTDWRLSIAGWTVGGEWRRWRSPELSFVMTADVTPLNAHGSNKVYSGGVRDTALDYGNRTLEFSSGLRLTPTLHATTDVRALFLYERVAGLGESLENFWRYPYAGLEVVQRYERLTAIDVLRAQWEGVRFSATGRLFTGATAWSRVSVSAGFGRRAGPLLLRGGGAVFTGRLINPVNSVLLGGSWDALGTHAVYGYRYGAFRVRRAALVNGGIDVPVARALTFGLRGAALRSSFGSHYGAMFNVGGVRNGLTFSSGIAFPLDRMRRRGRDRASLIASVGSTFLP